LQYYCNMGYIKEAEDILKRSGYKVTEPRKMVLRALDSAQAPLSPYDIQRQLKETGRDLNHVTIYRILDLLSSLNLAHRVITAGGFLKCTLKNEEGCHRYMVCRACGAVAEFSDGALCRQENEIAERLGFYAEQHITEFFGLCRNCRGSKRGGHR